MTLVKSDIPELLTAGLKTAFFQTFGETAAQWDKVATTIPSSRDTEQYAWLGALPGLREFRDERQPGDLKPYAYAIQNRTWESTISVDRTALEDDQYGQIALRIRQMAMAARSHLDSIVFGLLGTGFTQAGYDGVPFFGTHTQGSPQNNRGTDALNASSLQGAITQMMRFTDDQGRPAGTRPTLLVVPPELYWEATSLLTSAYFPDALTAAAQDLGANPLRGMLSLLTTPYLTSPSEWFLLDGARVVWAIVFQMRKEFEFGALEGSSENGFLRDQFLYGVRARYNAGFGDWRAAFGAQVRRNHLSQKGAFFMSVLPLAAADLKRLCAIDAGDTSHDADLAALLAAQQPVWEYGLDPAVLAASGADTGLRATLTLGLAEALAGEFLGWLARAPGVTDDFHLGPLSITASRTDNLARLGERLAAQGLRRLEPFLRASRAVGNDAAGGTGDGSLRSPLLASAPAGPSVFDLPLFDFPGADAPCALEAGL